MKLEGFLVKILIVNGHLHAGGVERSLINLLKTIDYSKHQVDLLLVEDLGEYVAEIPPQVNLFFYDLKPTYGSFFSVFQNAIRTKKWRLLYQKVFLTASNRVDRKALRYLDLPNQLRQVYDCAIAYRVDMPLDLVSFAIKAKKKAVWWHHGEFNYCQKQVKKWYEAFLRVDHIVCVSESTKAMLKPYFPDLAAKMCVVPNMIIPKAILSAAKKFNPYASISDKYIIVSVGRMSPEKHFIDIVDVMKKLRDRGIKNTVWYLVGDGIERKNIEERIKEYDLKDDIVLIGNQANPYPFIKYADLFVHPSWVESQGICVLEAMVLNKICIVVRSDGTSEFVVDRRNAIQADRTIQDLADKIEEALNDMKEIDYSDAQKQTVDRFLPEACMELFDGLIN